MPKSGQVGSNGKSDVLDIILDHPVEGKRLVIHGLEVTVRCVDGCEYSRRFKNKCEAQGARHLIAIFPEMWVKL